MADIAAIKTCVDALEPLPQHEQKAALRWLWEVFVLEPAKEAARKHHEEHGDITNGGVCLLNQCALHYPKD